MPANLPHQYFLLLKKIKKEKEPLLKINLLKELLKTVPKHKGTEKVQKEIKKKIAKLKEFVEKEKRKRGRISFYGIKKEGAGQVVIVGPPNSGKTTLFEKLTGVKSKIAPYPFTTKTFKIGMGNYENIKIQFIDSPPITKEFFPGWLKGILKNCDLVVALFKESERVNEQIKEFKEIFKMAKIKKKIIWVLNELNLGKTNQKFISISALEGKGVNNLKKEIFKNLEIIRVYSRKDKEIDFSKPFILKKGTTLEEFAKKIHAHLLKNFKGGKLFERGKKNPKIVGKNYLLKDGDIIEIRTH